MKLCIFQPHTNITQRPEVYDAESLTSPMVGLVPGINIFTDNLSVAQKAGSIPKGSSQAGFARFKEGSPTLGPAKKMITVQWVPSHVGI